MLQCENNQTNNSMQPCQLTYFGKTVLFMGFHAVLCCVLFCCVLLCYSVLYCAVLYCAVLCHMEEFNVVSSVIIIIIIIIIQNVLCGVMNCTGL